MTRGRKAGSCYVYVVEAGGVPLYVGKGTGRRDKRSAHAHGGVARRLEQGLTDSEAFNREKHWIAELLPENNVCAGGNGGRCRPRSKFDLPKNIEGVVSRAEWRRLVLESEAQLAEISYLGSRKYVARELLSRINEANCAAIGLSKVDVSRLREVANG